MTTHTAYEVRVQRQDNWRVEAVFDDEVLAIAAARRVAARASSAPVVVLQEIYDVARNHLKSRSIYRSVDVITTPRNQHSSPELRRGLLMILIAAAVIFGSLLLAV
ncbi:hypothetical protein [Govanella unica]|uniref:Uncharacterized protein n=1 Tax=Govanella unica TaxID=2975056 RepID=A0A9X3TWT6_9PROT|nr:hypothetical protein [Govania unica]MDA5193198.1 hypothetical protein [Govania unica]